MEEEFPKKVEKDEIVDYPGAKRMEHHNKKQQGLEINGFSNLKDKNSNLNEDY